MCDELQVCGWARQSDLERRYHDEEWGRLKRDDRTLFEFLVLESAQAGLSWRTVLNKRDTYRRHYENFEPEKVARFDALKVEAMLQDPGLIRNRAKIESSINNAAVFLRLSAEHQGFENYLWRFLDGQVQVNHWQRYTDAPAETPVSVAIAKDLKKQGVRFFGPTIVYAYLQACGYVNDHVVTCPSREASIQSAAGRLPAGIG